MSLQACANLVARADPERFAAAMAAPLAARAVLLPIYAASIEVARAPWVTQEPMIAEMRLQWWRDVFQEIEAGRPRKHEVVDALAPVLGPRGAEALDAMVLARRGTSIKKVSPQPMISWRMCRASRWGPCSRLLRLWVICLRISRPCMPMRRSWGWRDFCAASPR